MQVLRPEGKPRFNPLISPKSNPILKMIHATEGNKSFLGMVVMAVFGRTASNPPRLVSGTEIDKGGVVWGTFHDRNGTVAIVPLCTTEQITSDFRYLADHVRLDDRERENLFFELKAWLGRDHRAQSTQQ